METIDSPRHLPKVDDLLRDGRLDKAKESLGYVPVRDAVRSILEAARILLTDRARGSGNPADLALLERLLGPEQGQGDRRGLTSQAIISATLMKLEAEGRPGIRKVINATGAILHTNLGRAPLAAQALSAVDQGSRGYSSLEFDIEQNRRGQRTASIEDLLKRLFDVEAALVVNNNAAAVLLALSALCRGREVIVSRGELVEIGGRFRVPEIMEESGAILCEVGTTNKTRGLDYERAIRDSTAALLKVHRSNFRLTGFTEEVSASDLANLAKRHGLPLIYDLGSGCVSEELASLLPEEPTVASALESGAQLICFSGDKLLGGPQAGILIGQKEIIDILRSHPLMRAFRCDKMTLIALEATLRLYLDPEKAKEHIPLLSMALYKPDLLYERTSGLVQELTAFGIPARVLESDMILGGGAAPEVRIPSWALAIDPGTNAGSLSVTGLEASLRAFDPPILCRTVRDQLLFDLRTVSPEDEGVIKFALVDIFGREDRVL